MVPVADIELFYDQVPRTAATPELIGPFTLFVAQGHVDHPFYARPTLGQVNFSSDDVQRVLQAQRRQGIPMSIEWVSEITPQLERAAAVIWPVSRYPLLVFNPRQITKSLVTLDPAICRLLLSTEPRELIGSVVGSIDAAFRNADEWVSHPVENTLELMASGLQLIVGAFDTDGRAVGGGYALIRGGVAELAGIGVIPSHRGRGLGSAITRALTIACRERGVETIFLTAGSTQAASIYRTMGFEDRATACALNVPDPTIKSLAQADWQAFKKIRLTALAQDPAAFGALVTETQNQPDEEWKGRADQVVAVSLQDDLVAMGALYVPEPGGAGFDPAVRQGFIWGMWTDSRFRGLGFARQILSVLIDRSRNQGLQQLSLHVNTRLEGARAVYLAAGFNRTGERQPLRADTDDEIERLELTLG
jgi:ribosomal protein S18 acetylase RimI-like enzyme